VHRIAMSETTIGLIGFGAIGREVAARSWRRMAPARPLLSH
jgi:phosphoglycerate dehydrogenase-like enzyme